MAEINGTNLKPKIYKVVLTGGPCGGKTTGQARLASFFEELGWKVFTVPETASVLLNGGVKFTELNEHQTSQFQKDLLLTLIQIEKVFFNQAELILNKNVLIICDRGAIDPSAYINEECWSKILKDTHLNMNDLRDNRYNQVIHMVTAADGASNYYTLKNNAARFEDIEQAIEADKRTRNAWIGHPYFDIVDNSDCRKFDDKILKLKQLVCDRIGINYSDRLSKESRKRKWLVTAIREEEFDKYEEFTVRHDYLKLDNPNVQVRIRSRSQNGHTTYMATTRNNTQPNEREAVETRMQLTDRDYRRYHFYKDKTRATLHKNRRCFNYGTVYFHLDIYTDPLPPACQGKHLMILETYTLKPVGSNEPRLPHYLDIVREITNEPEFSMYSLSNYENKTIALDFVSKSENTSNEMEKNKVKAKVDNPLTSTQNKNDQDK